jgi:hypothetical protein
MGQTQDEITEKLAERWCWEVARRDDCGVARRLYRKQLVEGVYRLDEGALLDDFFHCLQAIGAMTLLDEAHGAAVHRAMVPFVQYVLLYGVKTLFGIERINALPRWLFSDEAFMRLVGFNARQVRQGICQRGATKRQGEQPPGPMCPATLAKNIAKWHLRELEAMFNGAPFRPWLRPASLGGRLRALPTARIWRRRRAMRGVARSPARCALKISGGKCPRSRSPSTAGRCSS